MPNDEKTKKLIQAGENYLKFAVEPMYGPEVANKFRKQRDQFITFLGIPLSYDTLREWVRCPYALDERENVAFREFVKNHGQEHSAFGWFFEVYHLQSQLSSNEVNCLLRTVDLMEAEGPIKEVK